jgi:hypothetical protein
MNDITNYSDHELSLLVFNDEGLYEQRHEDGFLDIIHTLFKYTDEQLSELKSDLRDDLAEHAAGCYD